ncbi:alpha-ribazole phosphatase [Wenyingzhuangia sp. IMCC45574]
MIVYFVRHTTPNIEKGICYGQADIDLSDTFEDESNFLLQKLSHVTPSNVISSPLQRCTQLAKKLSANFSTDPNIKELDFGKWELKAWNDIPTDEIDPWMEDFVNVAVPKGESYLDLYARSIAFYNTLKTENTVIVSHAGVLRSVLAHITKTDLQDSFNFKLPYGTIVKIDTNTNEYEIL